MNKNHENGLLISKTVHVQRESRGNYITGASSKNYFMWVRIWFHLVLFHLFFFPMSPSPALLFPLHYLFWSQSESPSPFGCMWDWLHPSSDHLPQCCFLREMPECFTGCATESQTQKPQHFKAAVCLLLECDCWQSTELHLRPLGLTVE